MKHLAALTVIVATMLLLGYGLLFSTLRHGVVDPEPKPTPEPVAVPMVVTAPVPAFSVAEPEQRVLVDDSELQRLRAENEALKARLASIRPHNRGDLAAVVGVKESEVDTLLDRSELLPDAKRLCDALGIAGAESVWKALQTEAALYRSFADFKAKHPADSDRMTWHHQQWVPFLSNQITQVCERLYSLNLPSSVVEPFRQRLTEGI